MTTRGNYQYAPFLGADGKPLVPLTPEEYAAAAEELCRKAEEEAEWIVDEFGCLRKKGSPPLP